MSKNNHTEPKNVSGIRPVLLQFSHPVETLIRHIGMLKQLLKMHLATAATGQKKCARDEDQLLVLREYAKSVLPQVEIAEITAKGISEWLRFGMMDGAGPFETRVREVLVHLNSIYRQCEHDVDNENENASAQIERCHAEIVVIHRKLRAAPLDPDDDAESMWSVYIAVFYQRLNKVAKCLSDLESHAGKSADSIAGSCKQMHAAIDALEAVLGSVKGQLANALYFEGQYRWPIECLTVDLGLYTLWFSRREPWLRDMASEALNHLRHILAVLEDSKRPALSTKAKARMWAEFPSDAKALKLPRPRTRGTTATAGQSVDLGNSTPDDLISMAVATQKFITSRQTIRRATKCGKIHSYRPPDAAKNSPHAYSESSLARIFQRR